MYQGVDLSAASVELCRALGLEAVVGSAVDLPYAANEFDPGGRRARSCTCRATGWRSRSASDTLIRPGGVLEVGVWGADEDGESTDPDGRYFRSRTDGDLQVLLEAVAR